MSTDAPTSSLSSRSYSSGCRPGVNRAGRPHMTARGSLGPATQGPPPTNCNPARLQKCTIQTSWAFPRRVCLSGSNRFTSL